MDLDNRLFQVTNVLKVSKLNQIKKWVGKGKKLTETVFWWNYETFECFCIWQNKYFGCAVCLHCYPMAMVWSFLYCCWKQNKKHNVTSNNGDGPAEVAAGNGTEDLKRPKMFSFIDKEMGKRDFTGFKKILVCIKFLFYLECCLWDCSRKVINCDPFEHYYFYL